MLEWGLGAAMVLFKAAFAGKELDRAVGADVVSAVLTGLVATTSPADPVLREIRDELKQLRLAPYEQAMAAGHRYLTEAQLDEAGRVERLKLARAQLVTAAAAAAGGGDGLGMPLLAANAELAVAKCDALLRAPAHARLALDRAASVIEPAIAQADVSGHRVRALAETRLRQRDSIAEWFNGLGDRNLITTANVQAAERQLAEARASLRRLTALYGEIQTAALAAEGRDGPVVWAAPDPDGGGWGYRAGDNAVARVECGGWVRGFGLTVSVDRTVVWRPDGSDDLVADLRVRMIAHQDRYLHCGTRSLTFEPTPPAPAETLRQRLADPLPALVTPQGRPSFSIAKGSYAGWLRVPVHGSSVQLVTIRIHKLEPTPAGVPLRPATGACVHVPVTP